MNKKDKSIDIYGYIEVIGTIIILLIMMFSLSNLEGFIIDKKEILYNKQYEGLKQNKNVSLNHYEEIYNDVLIIEGQKLKNREDLKKIYESIEQKKTIIFLNMPESDYIKKYKLEELLGIASIVENKIQKKLTLVPGFMLGGLHEFTNMSYESLKVDSLYSVKVYGFGENKEPIIWRNTYNESEIYVVNGPFMETDAVYGIFSSLMAEINEEYIYPIVNTRLMIYDGFPYVSYENKENLENLYNRSAMQLQYDILLSNILSINKVRNFIPNGYFQVGFNNIYKGEINKYNKVQVKNIKDQIYKEGGEIGIKYSRDIEFDKKKNKEILGENEINSILIEEKGEDLEMILKNFNKLKSIVGPFNSRNIFSYLSEDTVYIPYTIDGINNSGQEKLDYISAVTAFGAIIQKLSLEDIVMVEGEKENWTKISRDYIKIIDENREKFNFLENQNITQASNNIKIFRNNLSKIKTDNNKIEIRLDDWHGDSYFILRTKKKISNSKNVEIKILEEGIYLVTLKSKNADIYMENK